MYLKKRRKKASCFMLALLCALVLAVPASAADTPLVTTVDALTTALANAAEGDTVLVGDIDFTPPQGIFKSLMRIALNKDVTIRSGKKDGKAVFTGASFLLQGSKASDSRLTCTFAGICFDGGVDPDALTASDWECPVDEKSGELISTEPLLSNYAVSFRGNVDAQFTDCVFQNYMYEQGGAFNCFYGDYTGSPELLTLLGDYSACTLHITADGCEFLSNAAQYGGGAVYLEGNNKNVFFTASDCTFSGNLAGNNAFCLGGGAICASQSGVTLSHCSLTENTADHTYGELPETDIVQGGAVYCTQADLSMTDCTVRGNSASVGGGIAVCATETRIDGCVLAENCAQAHTDGSYPDIGPWSSMGLGGAMHINIENPYSVILTNTSVCGNRAEQAYGGVYAFYNESYANVLPYGFGTVEYRFCTFADNVCTTRYDYDAEDAMIWASHPGDAWAIPYASAFGCVVTDESFASDFPRHELPSADNGYNYFASPAQAEEDGIILSPEQDSGQLSVSAPKGADWSVPADFAVSLLGERYAGEKAFRIGSNYDPARYAAATKRGGIPIPALLAAGAAVLCAIAVPALRKRKTSEAVLEPQRVSEPQEAVLFSEERPERACAREEIAALLSNREQEVLQKLLEGKSREEIARELFITESTVKKHSSSIYAKLEVKNKVELIRKMSKL